MSSFSNGALAQLLGESVSHADPADIIDQRRSVDLEAAIEDYPWVRRDEVLTIDGRRFFI
jgi:hypothetical protein